MKWYGGMLFKKCFGFCLGQSFGYFRGEVILMVLLYSLLSGRCQAQDQWKNIYSQRAWQERDQWQRAEELIGHLNVRAGNIVADVGSHEGYMTLKLATAVGTRGKVYAVDVDQDKLDKLQKNLNASHVTQVLPTKGQYDNPNLPVGVDAVLILDAYHEMDAYKAMLGHIKRSLKVGGRLVICEPIADARRKADRKEQKRKHELGIAYALDDLLEAGFHIVLQQDPYIDREAVKGDKMWIIVAEKR